MWQKILCILLVFICSVFCRNVTCSYVSYSMLKLKFIMRVLGLPIYQTVSEQLNGYNLLVFLITMDE